MVLNEPQVSMCGCKWWIRLYKWQLKFMVLTEMQVKEWRLRNSSNVSTSFVFSLQPGQVRWGEVRQGKPRLGEQQQAAASLRAEALLLWSSTADIIIDGTSIPTRRPLESSPWIQAALISVIFISTLQKKRPKDPPAPSLKKSVCVSKFSRISWPKS